MIRYTPPKTVSAIPLVDLTGSFSDDPARRQVVAREVHKACRDTGFFYIANHGIPDAMLDRQLEWARRFFALPEEAKLPLEMSQATGFNGYETMRRQTLDLGSPPDLKEGFQFSQEGDAGSIGSEDRGEASKTKGNRWPADFSGFRQQMLEYQEQVTALGAHLMWVLALSLDLDEKYFDDALGGFCTVRILHYPPHPPGAASNQLGAGAHTDWGTITMLLQDDCGGLEVQHASGEWIRAMPIPGTLVVNLGDMIRRWTNDVYHSTMHRVLNASTDRDRYSVASFLNVKQDHRVECVPTCRPEVGEPHYAPCTVGEHIREMFERTYAQKASV